MKTFKALAIDINSNKLVLLTGLCFEFFRQYHRQSSEFFPLKIKAQVISIFISKNICF